MVAARPLAGFGALLSLVVLSACESGVPLNDLDLSSTPAPAAQAAPVMQPVVVPAANTNIMINTPVANNSVPTNTTVGRQIDQLRNDLSRLQGDVSSHAGELAGIRGDIESNASQYFTKVAEINARLQTGTTPGNPRLVEKWQDASGQLESFGSNITAMNSLASKLASSASMSAFLLESTRATYSLSGAVEEDHAQLANLEDEVNRTVVQIDRVLSDLNNDIDRQSNYLTSERRNLQLLSMAISNGEALGPSLSNRPMAAPMMAMQPEMLAPVKPVQTSPLGKGKSANTLKDNGARNDAANPAAVTSGSKPFVILRFERADMDYAQPLYEAMNKALDRDAAASFLIIAVSPEGSNPAETTLAVSEARRHAEDVMRTMRQMGMPAERMQMAAATRTDTKVSEVHIFLR